METEEKIYLSRGRCTNCHYKGLYERREKEELLCPYCECDTWFDDSTLNS